MKITKQLNNNIVIASDSQGREIVLMGKGIGFGRKPGMEPDIDDPSNFEGGTVNMALDYVETSKKIIEAVGGAGNISSAGNCMTRLRLVLKDDKKANDEKVQSIKGVKGVMRQGGQYQIIIGNEVSNLFKEFKKHGNWGEDGGGAPQKAEGNPVQRLFGFVSGCMTPMLPAMLGTGMLKVVLTLLTTFCGMSTESSTYILLFSFADCFFMFLPVFLDNMK